MGQFKGSVERQRMGHIGAIFRLFIPALRSGNTLTTLKGKTRSSQL